MRDPRINRIADVYVSRLTLASQGGARAGVAFLVFAALMWALLLLGIDRDSWPQQIGAPIGATVFGLLLLGFYPLYRKDGD